MALPPTIRRFRIDLSHVDAGLYESLDLRVAQHPSETSPYLITRLIAFCLEYTDGLAFSKGLCVPDEPAVWAHDPTGRLTKWIEVGQPSAERLHKASKRCEHLSVYTHRDPELIHREARTTRVHQAERIMVTGIDPELFGLIEPTIGRDNEWALVVSEGELYLTAQDVHASTTLRPTSLGSSPP